MIETTTLLIDDAGQPHVAAAAPVRIVSLVPSLTELLFDLGLGAQLVGRTDYCCHPSSQVAQITSVGGTKRVDAQAMAALAPTHVIVNVDETPRPLFDSLVADGYRVIVTHPQSVDDNHRLYRLIGGIFGRVAAADELARRLAAAQAEVVALQPTLPARPVLYLIWRKPWMTVSRDTYIARMLAQVNWRTEPAAAADRYPVIEMSEELLARVDHVLFASEPFPFGDKHVRQFQAQHPAHAHKALSIDGEMTSWYGSRAIAGLRYLAQLAQQSLSKE